MKKIPLIKPKINALSLKKAVDNIANSGMLTKGPYLHAFEATLRKYLGVNHVYATTSCTTALHLALESLGIGSGDEVLVSDFSFPATANVVVQVGAKPVFIDIDLGTYNLSPQYLEEKITKRSKAIIVVHAFGYPANITKIMQIAKRHKLKVIEDAACAIGSKHKNKYCGTMGDIGCFSFHPRKVITTGEGGAVVTNSLKIAKQIEILRNHGSIVQKNGSLSFVEAGFNYRMSELQAALGCEQMKKINSIIKKRQLLAHYYRKLFKNYQNISLPEELQDSCNNYQSFVILLPESADQNEVIKGMAKNNIETTLGTYALHAQPAYYGYGYKKGDERNSYIAYQKTLSLPLYDGLTHKQQKAIVDKLLTFIK